MPLKSKISRVIFILGIITAFLLMHFTDMLDRGGIEFGDLAKAFIQKPYSIAIYFGILTGPALLAATIIPATIKWIKSGE